MHQAQLREYIGCVFGAPHPLERTDEILANFQPLRGNNKHRNRDSALRLLSDFSGRLSQCVDQPFPTNIRPLSTAERILAFTYFHRPIFTAWFIEQIEIIVASEVAPENCRIEHSPLHLMRAPEHDRGLTKFYRLEEIRQSWWVDTWESNTLTRHHLLEESVGGLDENPASTVALGWHMHRNFHFLIDNIPPHLGLLLVLAWSKLDERRFDQHPHIWNGLFDLYRGMGRASTSIEQVYLPHAFTPSAEHQRQIIRGARNIKNEWKRKLGLQILHDSMHVGEKW